MTTNIIIFPKNKVAREEKNIVSKEEIDNIIGGTFTIPRFDSKAFSDIGKSNPALKPYLFNIQKTLNNLENQYLGKTLQTEELPDITIGD